MLKQKWVKEYLVFNRKDRIGVFVFIAVVSGCIFLPKLFSKSAEPLALKQDAAVVFAMDTLQKRQVAKKDFARNENENYPYRYERSETKTYTNGELFQFDPNTISLADWERLGLNERTGKTILKYVSKGGKFYKSEDLQKIWGMPEGFYERVKDYVKITSIARNYPAYENKPFAREERKPTVININEADTTAFIALPGIGSKLSARIINFREKLGGFYSIEQIGETWGLPDSTFQKLKPRFQISGENVRRINLNTATKDELKQHPYVRWNLANAIVEYRNQHGMFKNLEDLRNIALVDEATFEKIVHYLSL
ncbi:helix-hairpin-helix domain-containing protein [Flavisolibacter ginsenosidimutans]|uniref:Helix-hairpin-helix domain-containing protein n=1 Tax=Flavisolibacter ginsenosidimutans TaxID=661481 RepID=A0A5B8UNX7_9BACT|nr:helix-hairpin-helix domain-containing protein [Flavisolibacter ginsenosidimutans]QEC58334.1 helix-hairpin-helix domain-containing protein [Flavisolibacter ginsenosidimutans]